jgi:hypothetical protein
MVWVIHQGWVSPPPSHDPPTGAFRPWSRSGHRHHQYCADAGLREQKPPFAHAGTDGTAACQFILSQPRGRRGSDSPPPSAVLIYALRHAAIAPSGWERKASLLTSGAGPPPPCRSGSGPARNWPAPRTVAEPRDHQALLDSLRDGYVANGRMLLRQPRVALAALRSHLDAMKPPTSRQRTSPGIRRGPHERQLQNGTIKRKWRTPRARSGWPHDFRRTAVRSLERVGVHAGADERRRRLPRTTLSGRFLFAVDIAAFQE